MTTESTMIHHQADTIDVRVCEVLECGRDTKAYKLQPLTSEPLPMAEAGAHIDLILPTGLIRQYSVILRRQRTEGYWIAVKKDVNSRGGSLQIHGSVIVGTILKVKAPRNNFPLDEGAPHSVLIAGGIGITPIVSMINRLVALGKSWELYYACRSRADLSLLEEIPAGQNAHFHLDDESDGKYLDLSKIVGGAPAGAHFYCCGPLPLMAAFDLATADIPDQRKHVEYFTARESEPPQGGFRIKLARSGKVLNVPQGGTILDALKEAGIPVEHSCAEGICGTCETTVLAGIPDHRDSVLTPSERAANNTIMVCCSGSKSEELVLDL
ncbi:MULTISPECIES: PDR/VanB family oxidoreductase [Bradyrhizobium]|uniref:PDR/VanB family oxidoreductase n=1 Tax=Bradyrhizobium TaxID=374 RepID=UPI0014491D6A|nr:MULTISPECIES: PDR/VanB family oxidoreductase [Bradyrhizobium]MCP1924703.1 ferredoxin-NADP reductase [Bradyrhizobium elkanii]MCS3584537.1 ferredoxin-NADP reductase [Bradyrhizobium elkanii]MCS3718117.1 ferredoxin-NADP reductase [Bradyrhizobium elkanii]MCS4011825.1 ferredoxin-NADP reductase [Bradyrhizobium elkanii USDA 61]BBB97684.1 vanillate O-demethylase oxidoreductase [Bradyrhizobium elkanii USDA 61]